MVTRCVVWLLVAGGVWGLTASRVAIGGLREDLGEEDGQTETGSAHIVRTGDNVTLECEASQRWFFCLWRTPGGGKVCAINETGTYHSVCSGSQGLSLTGNSTVCRLHISHTTEEQAGTYICLLNQADTFLTDRSHFEVEVATPSHLALGIASQDNNSQKALDSTLEILEGQSVDITCRADYGFPLPHLAWSSPPPSHFHPPTPVNPSRFHAPSPSPLSLSPVFGQNRGKFILYKEANQQTDQTTTDGGNEIRFSYTGSLEDNGHVLSCLGEQRDHSGLLLYNSSVSVVISVRAAAPLSGDSTLDETGIIILVLALLAILLLVVAFIIVFLCCKKKNNKTSGITTQSEGAESCLEKGGHINPIWISKASLAKRALSCSPKRYPLARSDSQDPYRVNAEVHNSSSSSNSSNDNNTGESSDSSRSSGNRPCAGGKGGVNNVTDASAGSYQTSSTDTSFETERSVGEDGDNISFSPTYAYTGYLSFNTYDNIEIEKPKPAIYSPKGLGQFDPTVNIHEVTRPNTGDSHALTPIYDPGMESVRGYCPLSDLPCTATHHCAAISPDSDEAKLNTSVFDCQLGCFSPEGRCEEGGTITEMTNHANNNTPPY